MREFIHAAIATVLLVWPASTVVAEELIHTDANLVTALDVSDSIMRHEEWLEFEGLAKAVVDAAVLDAITGGRYGRIGFCRIHMVECRSLSRRRALDHDRFA